MKSAASKFLSFFACTSSVIRWRGIIKSWSFCIGEKNLNWYEYRLIGDTIYIYIYIGCLFVCYLMAYQPSQAI